MLWNSRDFKGFYVNFVLRKLINIVCVTGGQDVEMGRLCCKFEQDVKIPLSD